MPASPALLDFISTAATEQLPPAVELLDDKPEYTKILTLRAEGYGTRAIARECNYSVSQVQTVCRQVWFKNKLRELIALAGADRLERLYRLALEDSLETLIDLRDTSKSDQVRFNSAVYLTDRVIGKPIQQIVSDQRRTSYDVNEIDKELEDLRRDKEEVKRRLAYSERTENTTTS